MRVVAIVQARMGSSRLPGKVLADLGGRPMLKTVIDRVSSAKRVDEVVVATTVGPADDALAATCMTWGVTCVRGSETDVLDRYVNAARAARADVVLRVTGDCPLIDPGIVDRAVDLFLTNSVDYVSNKDPPTFPDGQDVEVVSRSALERAAREAVAPSDREHVTPYIRGRPDQFSRMNFEHVEDLSKMRWTVDDSADLEFVRGVVDRLGPMASFDSIVALLRAVPEIGRLNSGGLRDAGYLRSLASDPVPPEVRARRGPELYETARMRIPGGTQLLSKRPEMFLPGRWPAYFSRAKGVEVWDLDGRRYIDMSYNGIGASILGAADPDVDAAVKAVIDAGVVSTLNCPEEVELADVLLELNPWAEMVRYARTGGEAMAVAVRIARASSGKDVVAFCGYHGWHDWYLAANLAEDSALDGHLLPGLDPVGVPRALRGTALPFRFNHSEELDSIVSARGSEIGAIVMEPVRNHSPLPGFLEHVRATADRLGVPLVFDEISSGFRLTTGGAHRVYGVDPDIAVFGKAMGNGYPMAAIVGRRRVMEAAQSTFISSTFWTDRVGPAAALATLRKYRANDVSKHLDRIGRRVQDGWTHAAEKVGLPIHVGGMPPMAHFQIDHPDGLAAQTLFVERMLRHGFLAGKGFYATFAHTDAHVDAYLEAVSRAFAEIAEALKIGDVQRRLDGPTAHNGFRRLT